jgi:hypothetical protein
MDTAHRWFDYDRTFKEKYLTNFKYLFKLIFIILLISDYIYFTVSYPNTALRFARIVRPGNNYMIKGLKEYQRYVFKEIFHSKPPLNMV